MTEDCAHGMSASQGCNDDTVVVESFKEALRQRIGDDRYRLWFTDDVRVSLIQDAGASDSPKFVVSVRGEFAQQRLSRNLMSEMRGAATQARGEVTEVDVEVFRQSAKQTTLPLECDSDGGRGREHRCVPSPESRPTYSPQPHHSRGQTAPGQTSTLDSLITKGLQASDRTRPIRRLRPGEPAQPNLPNLDEPPGDAESKHDTAGSSEPMTLSSYFVSDCNRLAHTAAMMVVQNPGAASPLFLAGPTGVGKTHLLSALADSLRRRHRMRRVVHSSMERFTNEFITSIKDSSLTSFRRRFRDVDALLIDDVQFVGKKTATLREVLYTVDELTKAGRPMVFSGSKSPGEIPGLSSELAARLSSGLVCCIETMDTGVREAVLRRMIDRRCQVTWPEDVIREISSLIAGDGRAISGIVNLVATLQRMYGRMPTMDEVRQFGADLLRSSTPIISLTAIERAVCETFHLRTGQLQTPVQARAISEPRMLAMYLSRELTSSAFAEISRHYGGRSHSTAIMASKRVKQWLESEKVIGRGAGAMTAKDALRRIENLLRTG